MPDPAQLLPHLVAIAVEAGVRIIEIRQRPHGVMEKSDGSPVTEADLAGEQVIAAGLARHMPAIPVISEEDAARHGPPGPKTFILVDPLDGTREFIGPSGEFTVNIALIDQGRPICGVVYAPALSRIWRGLVGRGAERAMLPPGADPANARWSPSTVRQRPEAGWTAVASRSHLDPETQAFLARLPVADSRSIGSSLKFCLVADGEADVYPRFGQTYEWDTAAGHAVLEAAGGRVLQPDGSPFVYGKAEANYMNGAFVAWGGRPAGG
jgi:3'(2'), 5'-bisphosphate nucleotidase